MVDRDELYPKFRVQRTDTGEEVENPEECVVLRWADPVARFALLAWADSLEQAGLPNTAREVRERLGVL